MGEFGCYVIIAWSLIRNNYIKSRALKMLSLQLDRSRLPLCCCLKVFMMQ